MVLQDEHMDVRILHTEQFGDIPVEPRHIFTFADGLLGFEDYKDFVLIKDEDSAPIRWLISLDDPNLGFPVIAPVYIDPNYVAGREYTDTSVYVTLVIITLANTGMTANMKAPVVLNIEQQTGKQVILSSDKYSPHHPLGNNSQA
ncbi:MAG: flagellar assembly protein FliW [Candidatus Kapabacteria bacterium]|nr:flagellar assembly protein FliW [Candidatus Kapabacteria bacterium]MBX7154936.1 flagellar assembly protein FliW [Bacteroidota bacterium]